MTPSFKNEVGNRYGKLTVLEKTENKKGGHIHWKCLCDCGKLTEVSGASLRRGNTKSCGCLAIDLLAGQPPRNSIEQGEAAFNRLYISYQRNAIMRNLEWKLDKQIFRELTKENCYYCGAEASQTIGKKNNGLYFYNGLDRKNSSIGYVPGNVVPCCGTCNKLKGQLDHNDFLKQIQAIACHQNSLAALSNSGLFSIMDSQKQHARAQEVRRS